VKQVNINESLGRLENDTEKTTKIYRQLMKRIKTITKPSNESAIGVMHRLRSGFNFYSANAKLKHLSNDDKVSTYKVAETELHL